MIRRRLFLFSSFVSLLLCIATAALWVRSYFVADNVMTIQYRFAPGIGYRYTSQLISCWGHLSYGYVHASTADPAMLKTFHRSSSRRLTMHSPAKKTWMTDLGGPRDHNFLGFLVQSDSAPILSGNKLVTQGRSWMAPYAVFVGLFATLPVLFVIRRKHLWKYTHGCCLACGYSLTGNTSGTCPECGTPILAAVPTQPA